MGGVVTQKSKDQCSKFQINLKMQDSCFAPHIIPLRFLCCLMLEFMLPLMQEGLTGRMLAMAKGNDVGTLEFEV
jgi:hypothetical protein